MIKQLLYTVNILVLFLYSVDTSAQQPNMVLDSLESELRIASSDEQRIILLVALSEELLLADTISGPGYASEAIELGEKLGLKERVIDAKISLARFWIRKVNDDLGDSLLKEVYNESASISYPRGIAWGHYYRAFETDDQKMMLAHLDSAKQIFDEIGDKRSSIRMMIELADEDEGLTREEKIQQFHKVADIATEINYDHGIGEAYFNIAQEYSREAKRKLCIDYYFMAIEAFPNTSKESIANAYNNIAIQLEDQDYSMKYHKQALEIWIEIGSVLRVIIGTSNIGATYYVLKDYEKALEHHQQAMEYNKVLKDSASDVRISINHGKVYDQLGEYNKAIEYFAHAKQIASMSEDINGEAWACLSLARVYRKKKEYNPALLNVERALSLYTQIEWQEATSDCLEVKYQIYKEIGNYKLAFENLEMFKILSDSIYNEEQTREITRLIDEHEFQLERDSIAFEQEKTELTYKQEIQKRKVINQAAIGGGLLSLVILIILYRSNQLKKQKNKELHGKNEAISQLRNTEKKMAEETLALKERELTAITMLSHERNSLLKQLGDQIGGLSDKVDDEVIPDLKEIKRTIKSNLNDESWSTFMYQFEKVHPDFFNLLKSKFPSITQHDLRLCAYIKVGMDNKEIANISNVTTPSVKKSINRLKKKMELDVETDLRNFLMKL